MAKILAGALGALGALALLPPAAWAQFRGTWERAAPMPEKRSEIAAAELGGKIYVAGGIGGSNRLLEFDPEKNSWRLRARLPLAVFRAAAASAGGRLYVIGGFTHGENAVSSVFEWDPRRDRWRERARMPTPRGSFAAATLGGRIHAVGGMTGPERTPAPTRSTIPPPTGGRGALRFLREGTTWPPPSLAAASTSWAGASAESGPIRFR